LKKRPLARARMTAISLHRFPQSDRGGNDSDTSALPKIYIIDLIYIISVYLSAIGRSTSDESARAIQLLDRRRSGEPAGRSQCRAYCTTGADAADRHAGRGIRHQV